jgi:hypothetical protein
MPTPLLQFEIFYNLKKSLASFVCVWEILTSTKKQTKKKERKKKKDDVSRLGCYTFSLYNSHRTPWHLTIPIKLPASPLSALNSIFVSFLELGLHTPDILIFANVLAVGEVVPQSESEDSYPYNMKWLADTPPEVIAPALTAEAFTPDGPAGLGVNPSTSHVPVILLFGPVAENTIWKYWKPVGLVVNITPPGQLKVWAVPDPLTAELVWVCTA